MDFLISGRLKLQEFMCEKTLVKHKCRYCNFMTNFLVTLNEHLGRHDTISLHNNNIDLKIKVYTCGICNFTTHSIIVLISHQKQCTHVYKEECFEATCFTKQHVADENKLNASKYPDKTISKTYVSDNKCHTVSEEIKLFQCDRCEFKAKRKHNLKQHINVRHTRDKLVQLQCTLCSFKTVNKNSLRNHMNEQHVEFRWFECDQCGYNTKRKGSLENHYSIKHNREKLEQLKCSQCSFTTVHSRSIKRHMNTRHADNLQRQSDLAPENLTRYECKDCSYNTRHQKCLKRHIVTRHTDPEEIEWFECVLCEYKAKRKEQLKKHVENRHVGENPVYYKCTYCTYNTAAKTYLKNHIAAHHTDPEHKPKLKGSFNLKHNHDSHDRENMEYECTYCTYKTSFKPTLKRHIVTRHTNPERIKWFHCGQCEYKAKRKDNLRQHVDNIHARGNLGS